MNTKIALLTLAAFALSANTAIAKKTDKMAKPAAEVYKIDANASTVEWIGSKATGAKHNGFISISEGQIEMVNSEIKAGQFTTKMDTLTNKDLESTPDYKTKLETHLKSEDFFNVAKYPQATFKIKSVTKKSDTEVMIKGDLTMIGKTQPVEFPATIKMEAGKVMGTADIKLDRTKWDLKYGSGKFFKNLGDKLISDDFNLKLNLVATK